MESEEIIEEEEAQSSDIQIVKGLCDLLQQTGHMDIVRYTIKACTYISMNYKFIKNSKFSKDILK